MKKYSAYWRYDNPALQDFWWAVEANSESEAIDEFKKLEVKWVGVGHAKGKFSNVEELPQKPKPRIVIHVEGGIVQDFYTNIEDNFDVVVIDTDVEGINEKDLVPLDDNDQPDYVYLQGHEPIPLAKLDERIVKVVDNFLKD